MEARLAALETTARDHDKRLGRLEREQAATDARVDALREDVKESKEAAKHAAAGVDKLIWWLLGTVAVFALNLLYMILKGV